MKIHLYSHICGWTAWNASGDTQPDIALHMAGCPKNAFPTVIIQGDLDVSPDLRHVPQEPTKTCAEHTPWVQVMLPDGTWVDRPDHPSEWSYAYLTTRLVCKECREPVAFDDEGV